MAARAVRLENRSMQDVVIRTATGDLVPLNRKEPPIYVDLVAPPSDAPFKFTVSGISDIFECSSAKMVTGEPRNVPPYDPEVVYIVSVVTYDALRIVLPERNDFVLVDWTRMEKDEKGRPICTLGVATRV